MRGGRQWHARRRRRAAEVGDERREIFPCLGSPSDLAPGRGAAREESHGAHEIPEEKASTRRWLPWIGEVDGLAGLASSKEESRAESSSGPGRQAWRDKSWGAARTRAPSRSARPSSPPSASAPPHHTVEPCRARKPPRASVPAPPRAGVPAGRSLLDVRAGAGSDSEVGWLAGRGPPAPCPVWRGQAAAACRARPAARARAAD
jgi:hypothetical protein